MKCLKEAFVLSFILFAKAFLTEAYTPKEWNNITSCEGNITGSTKRHSCVFPFTYETSTYNGCYDNGTTKPWCLYDRTDTSKWVYCDESCPVANLTFVEEPRITWFWNSIALTCSVKGSPNPTLKWIAKENDTTYVVLKEKSPGDEEVTSIGPQVNLCDKYRYFRCRAINEYADIFKDIVVDNESVRRSNSKATPTFLDDPIVTRWNEANGTKLECSVRGSTNVSMEWYGRKSNESEFKLMKDRYITKQHTKPQTLQICISPCMEYKELKCVVRNKCGEKFKEIGLGLEFDHKQEEDADLVTIILGVLVGLLVLTVAGLVIKQIRTQRQGQSPTLRTESRLPSNQTATITSDEMIPLPPMMNSYIPKRTMHDPEPDYANDYFNEGDLYDTIPEEESAYENM